MNWTMPYPWRSPRDSVRKINMSSEPGNESFFFALRPIPRILSLQRRAYPSQVGSVALNLASSLERNEMSLAYLINRALRIAGVQVLRTSTIEKLQAPKPDQDIEEIAL